ncbi:hypothetical protein SCHPADRAFT_945305 [Schizopora paradoxa]|uniref:Uncharacterized protein n=1 Tax=Schizopora paradoxa TaxID=27342 RepID=A0A0H2R7T1_9AGAM|nr:hypothetical protein SCHPADRAFT_945305 [Schizopora paradoxa]
MLLFAPNQFYSVGGGLYVQLQFTKVEETEFNIFKACGQTHHCRGARKDDGHPVYFLREKQILRAAGSKRAFHLPPSVSILTAPSHPLLDAISRRIAVVAIHPPNAFHVRHHHAQGQRYIVDILPLFFDAPSLTPPSSIPHCAQHSTSICEGTVATYEFLANLPPSSLFSIFWLRMICWPEASDLFNAEGLALSTYLARTCSAHMSSSLALPDSFSPHRYFSIPALSSHLAGTASRRAYFVSPKPWTFINEDSIHDIAALEAHAAVEAEGGDAAAEKRTKGWTFRRTDNLRLWAAALKLRYLLPLVTPPTSSGVPTHADALKSVIAGSSTVSSSAATTPTASPAPTQTKFHIPPPNSAGLASSASAPTVAGSRRVEAAPGSVIFDAKVVARKDEGWDSMLEHVVFRWIGAVVDEERRDR